MGTTFWCKEKPMGLAGISAFACTSPMPTNGYASRVHVDHVIDALARPTGDAGGSPG